MPYTISHAAAVLPLRKTPLPLAALMIGSMVPDFAYFLPRGLLPNTHTLAGLLWFCLPVGLATWLVFTGFVERPSIALLPRDWRLRMAPTARPFTLALLLRVALAVLLGAVTHLLWDSLTHSETALGDTIPALQTVTLEIRGRALTVYRVLQYVSSVGGLLVLALWTWRIRRWPVVTTEDPGAHIPDSARVAVALVLITATAGGALAYLSAAAHLVFGRRMSHLLVGAMTGAFLSWFLVAVFARHRWLRQRV